MIKDEFIRKLTDLRFGSLTPKLFVDWMMQNEKSLSSFLIRGIIIKLKNFEPTSIILCMNKYLCDCSSCVSFFSKGDFYGQNDFSDCLKSINLLLSSRHVVEISKPDYLRNLKLKNPLVVFYKCSNCDSIWMLDSPERAHKGGWFRCG